MHLDSTDITQSLLVVVRGIPGSGKSYLTAELEKAIDHDRLVVLDPDATDYTSHEYIAHTRALTTEGVDPKLHAYRFLRGKAFKAIEAGKIIVWNQPFTSLEIFDKVIAKLREHAKQHHAALKVMVVEVVTDPAIAKERVKHRKRAGGHGPSEATFDRFVSDFISFDGHGYQVLQVQGDAPVHESVAAIERAM